MTVRGVPGVGTASNPSGMARITSAALGIGQTRVDPTVGFDDLFPILVLCTSVGLAVLVALAAGALWLSSRAVRRTEADRESGDGALLP